MLGEGASNLNSKLGGELRRERTGGPFLQSVRGADMAVVVVVVVVVVAVVVV